MTRKRNAVLCWRNRQSISSVDQFCAGVITGSEKPPPRLTTLKVGPRQLFVAVESTSCDSWHLLVIHSCLTVLHNDDGSSDKRGIEALPFSRFARQLRRGGKESVHPARMVTARFLHRVGLDLHLITAPQIHATVGLGAAAKLQIQFEILKRGRADDFSAMSVINQVAAFDLPIARPACITKPPAGEILALEQIDGLALFRGDFPLQGGGSMADPIPGNCAGADGCSHKLATDQLPL
jgi:hypothetical protein